MKNILKPVSGLLCTMACLLCVAPITTTLAQDKFPTGSFVGGMFTLTFNSDGSHTVSAQEKTVVKGTHTVTQDEIVFTDKEGEYACSEAMKGKYKWKYDGKALTFSKLEDECEGRVNGLTGQPFAKK
jgi:hypothetical protein